MTDKHQQEFNQDLTDSKHREHFSIWLDEELPRVMFNRFLEYSFNSQQGHLLSYLREERGIDIIHREAESDGTGVTWVFNLIEIPNMSGAYLGKVREKDYNEGLQESILIAMNHE